MNILYLLIPLALSIGLGFVFLFIWATKNGQFDDLDTPAYRLLLDEENEENEEKINLKNGKNV